MCFLIHHIMELYDIGFHLHVRPAAALKNKNAVVCYGFASKMDYLANFIGKSALSDLIKNIKTNDE